MPKSIGFTLANPITHRQALMDMNLEYMAWVAEGIEAMFGIASDQLQGMDLSSYVAGAIDKVCGEPPPRGAFYLVFGGDSLAGITGLRPLADGAAEIKRIYVRSAFRGMHLGQSILQRLLDNAQAFGYQMLRLDSAPFMQSTQRMSAAVGFVDCGPYPGLEVPAVLHGGWRFLERVASAR